MTYKDNTPTFNVNRTTLNFKDWLASYDSEKEELRKMKRGTKPNSERQKLLADKRAKYNLVTHKNDYISPGEVRDKLNAIEESQMNESHVDEQVYHELRKLGSYRTLVEKFKEAVSEFQDSAEGIYDEGDNDAARAFGSVLQDALDEAHYF